MHTNLHVNNMNSVKFSQNLFNENPMANGSTDGFLNILQMMIAENNKPSGQELSHLAENLQKILGNDLQDLENPFLFEFDTVKETFKPNVYDDDKIKEKQKELENLIGSLDVYNLPNFSVLDILNSLNERPKIPNSQEQHYMFENYDFLNKFKSSENIRETDIISQIASSAPKAEKLFEINKEQIQFVLPEEKLTSEAESKKVKINEADYNSELIFKNNFLTENENTIKITDESTDIKPQILTQVKDKITFMMEEGEINSPKEVTMELQPHNLGKVNIKITFENEELKVEIKALNKETEKILLTNKDEITNALGKTIEKAITIDVRPQELAHDKMSSYHYQNKQSYEEAYYERNHQSNQNSGNSRQNNSSHQEKKDDEDMKFSDLINLRNFSVNT